MTDIDLRDLSRRYIGLWNEPDAGLRRDATQRLWAADRTHILQPPAEIREVAAGLGFDSTALEAHGHDAIETRVTRSHERFVAYFASSVGRGPGRSLGARDVTRPTVNPLRRNNGGVRTNSAAARAATATMAPRSPAVSANTPT